MIHVYVYILLSDQIQKIDLDGNKIDNNIIQNHPINLFQDILNL